MRVIGVDPGSLADRSGLHIGDVLRAINGEPIGDPIDYRFHTADEVLELLVERAGRLKTITLRRALDEDIGIALEDMRIRVCPNRCIFCFVDQLPPGMRPTLYLKDDDYRLSFLHGAYVTLAGLEAAELHRIVRQKLSPLYISIHTTSPELRCRMMGNGEAGDVLESIRFLTDNGIELHGQVVLCPEWNDGTELDRTVEALRALFPQMRSLALVPVGLTRYRVHLPQLRGVDRGRARAYVSRVQNWQSEYRRSLGEPFVYLADELYLLAGAEIPSDEHYAEFPQIENGVGMARMFLDRFRKAEHRLPERVAPDVRVSLVTGVLARPLIAPMARVLSKIPGLSADVISVPNAFFGAHITTSGLLTGRDIVQILSTHRVGEAALLPPNCVNADGVLLDDMTPEEIGSRIGVRTTVASYDLVESVCEVLETRG